MTTDQSPFHPLSFSQGIGVTIGAICFVLVVVILAATLPALCRRAVKDKYLGILTGDFTSEWQGIEKRPLSEEGYVVADATTPSRGELFEKQFFAAKGDRWLREETGIELFPDYDSEEEQEVRDLIDQQYGNWDMGSPDELDLGTEGEGEEVVTEMMEESDPELSDLWPSDDVPLVPRHKKRVSFAEPEAHTQRSGRESMLRRLSLLRQKKERRSSDTLAGVPAGTLDILASDRTESVVAQTRMPQAGDLVNGDANQRGDLPGVPPSVLKKARQQGTGDERMSYAADSGVEARRNRRKKSRQRRRLPVDNEQELLIEESESGEEIVRVEDVRPMDHHGMCLEEEDEEERAGEFSSYRWLPLSESPKETAARLRHVVESGQHVQLFESLKQVHPGSSNLHAVRECNKTKNRYRDVLPLDHARVRLREVDQHIPGADYINASHLRLHDCCGRYIATQGPLLGTIADFWQMAWEQNAEVIVMTTKLVEGGRKKCERYWPDEGSTLQHGTVRVTNLGETSHGAFIKRQIRLAREGSMADRELVHLQYTPWLDDDVPTSPADFLTMVDAVKDGRPSIVAHCSAGLGRTGVFVTVHAALALHRAGYEVRVEDIVRLLRRQRKGMVRTVEQFEFCFLAIAQALDPTPTQTECPEQPHIESFASARENIPTGHPPVAGGNNDSSQHRSKVRSPVPLSTPPSSKGAPSPASDPALPPLDPVDQSEALAGAVSGSSPLDAEETR